MTPGGSEAVIAIAGMAAVTYVARAGGLVIARTLPATPFAAAFLRHLGTSTLVALVAATVARTDVAGLAATVLTIAFAALGRPTSGLLAGMALAALLRGV